MPEGSEIWQNGFFLICGLYLLIEVWRGWRSGFIRSVIRLVAIFFAYGVGVVAGAILLPALRSFIRAPDLVIQVGVALVIGVLVYLAISILAALLFKRTSQQPSGLLRFFYGAGGAVCGMIFGLLIVWGAISLTRVLGVAGEAEILEAEEAARQRAELGLPEASEPPEDLAIARTLAKLKASLESGETGQMVEKVDLVPSSLYRVLSKLNRVSNDPIAAQRFVSHPGAQSILEDPILADLLSDPEIGEAAQQKNIVAMMSNPKIIQAVNNPQLLEKLKAFPLEEALDYALQPGSGESAAPRQP